VGHNVSTSASAPAIRAGTSRPHPAEDRSTGAATRGKRSRTSRGRERVGFHVLREPALCTRRRFACGPANRRNRRIIVIRRPGRGACSAPNGGPWRSNLGIPRQLKDAASASHSAKAESPDISIAYASGVSITLSTFLSVALGAQVTTRPYRYPSKFTLARGSSRFLSRPTLKRTQR
jgi:hypothetical protein